MSKNIKYQFLYAINENFKENQDKHSLKKQHLVGQETIFSYSSRTDLINLSSNFANWLKETHPEIKKVKDISASNIAEFLSHKVDNCSQKTLEHYSSLFRKLSLIVNSTYHLTTDYTKDLVIPLSNKNGGGKIRTLMLETNDYNILLNTTNNNLKKALLLSQQFGLRSSEIGKLFANDIRTNTITHSSTIHIIDSKGKRNRIIPVETPEQKHALAIVQSLLKNNRVCPVQHESLEQAFRRELKRYNLDTKYKNGCFHLCRKAFATSQYQQARSSGLSVKESMSHVSVLLGHGKERFDLMREYICCPLV